MKNLLIGNGINIQHGGYDFTNNAIVLRALQNSLKDDSPEQVIPTIRFYLGRIFEQIPFLLKGEFDKCTRSPIEEVALSVFKAQYRNKTSLKITDIGFEHYYFLSELVCIQKKQDNSAETNIRKLLTDNFLHSIYNDGKVNQISQSFTVNFVQWMESFDNIFTTNYDTNVDDVVTFPVHHLHGNFRTLNNNYDPYSLRNQMSDAPLKSSPTDPKYPHIYSTAISHHSGEYKEEIMKENQLTSEFIENTLKVYENNEEVREKIESWRNSHVLPLRNLYEGLMLVKNNPEKEFKQHYPYDEFKNMTGELTILGLSPYNDKHIFQMINDSGVEHITFYYYEKAEKKDVAKVIQGKEIAYESALKFWGTAQCKKKVLPKRTTKQQIMNKKGFLIFLKNFQSETMSIINLTDLILQYNQITNEEYDIILEKVSLIQETEKAFTNDTNEQEMFRKTQYHVIAEEHSIDPATVCLVKWCEKNRALISLK